MYYVYRIHGGESLVINTFEKLNDAKSAARRYDRKNKICGYIVKDESNFIVYRPYYDLSGRKCIIL